MAGRKVSIALFNEFICGGGIGVNLCDPSFAEYLKDAEIIEKVDITNEVIGVFLKQGKKKLPFLNYPYRLVCFQKKEGKILFTVNLEISFFGTCCLGVHMEDSHCTLMIKIENMEYETLRENALDIARKIIAGELCKDVNPEEM